MRPEWLARATTKARFAKRHMTGGAAIHNAQIR